MIGIMNPKKTLKEGQGSISHSTAGIKLKINSSSAAAQSKYLSLRENPRYCHHRTNEQSTRTNKNMTRTKK